MHVYITELYILYVYTHFGPVWPKDILLPNFPWNKEVQARMWQLQKSRANNVQSLRTSHHVSHLVQSSVYTLFRAGMFVYRSRCIKRGGGESQRHDAL